MTIWGKFRNLFAPKCLACRVPLAGDQVDFCSPACKKHATEMQAFSV